MSFEELVEYAVKQGDRGQLIDLAAQVGVNPQRMKTTAIGGIERKIKSQLKKGIDPWDPRNHEEPYVPSKTWDSLEVQWKNGIGEGWEYGDDETYEVEKVIYKVSLDSLESLEATGFHYFESEG